MKLLVLTTRLFDTPASGGEICTARLLEGLGRAGHEVTLLGRGDATAAARHARRVVSLGPLEPPFDEQGTGRRAAAVLGALLSGQSITVHRQGGHRMAALVAPWLAASDAVIVDHLQAWPWLGAQPARPAMLVQHNVESDNYLRRSRAANRGYQGNPRTRWLTRFVMRRESTRLLALELQALQRAAVVACLSDGDAQRLAELAQRAGRDVHARLLVLPGYPLGPASPPRAGTMPPAVPAIGLIGTWTWAPNREGLRWLLEQVWPRLQGRARLVLAGNGLEGLALPPGTQVMGRVAEVGDFLDAVDLIAIPSRSGSGVQEKAIEAIACGRPVVATPHALRGLGDRLPATVARAADAAAFAAACEATLGLATAPRPVLDPEGVERWCSERRQRYAEALGLGLHTLLAARTTPPTLAPVWRTGNLAD